MCMYNLIAGSNNYFSKNWEVLSIYNLNIKRDSFQLLFKQGINKKIEKVSLFYT